MTVVSDAVAAGPSGDSYGAKLECPSTHVGLMTAAATWRSGGEFLGLLRSHRNYSSSIVLQRVDLLEELLGRRDGVVH